MTRNKADLVLGLCVIVLASIAIIAWVPNDSATGLLVKQRGRLLIGDTMAPTIAFGLVVLGGLLIVFKKSADAAAERLTKANVWFLLLFTGVFLLTMILFRWSGPVLVGVAGAEDASYRALRDTFPWKYAGFVIGGTFMVTSLIVLVEKRLTWRVIAVGLLAVAGLIVVFDLPFPDLLLPPNGDV